VLHRTQGQVDSPEAESQEFLCVCCRYLVLSASLRATARCVLLNDPPAAAEHAIHCKVTVVSIPKQDGLKVVIPLSCQSKADEPFARAVVNAITDEVASIQQQPKYTFWESKVSGPSASKLPCFSNI
jgi:hypothetical protein